MCAGRSSIASISRTCCLSLRAGRALRSTPIPCFRKIRRRSFLEPPRAPRPFRLNLHVADVGHTLIFGPTGAGKSTLLAVIAAQFLRYPSAKITAFDKGRSLLALAYGVGGRHYDLGGERGIGLAPLAALETESDLAFAGDWIESAYSLQAGSAPSPRQKHEIHRALLLLRDAPAHRSLTDFVTTVQDESVRAALAPYTLDGPLGSLLDARSDGVSTRVSSPSSRWRT